MRRKSVLIMSVLLLGLLSFQGAAYALTVSLPSNQPAVVGNTVVFDISISDFSGENVAGYGLRLSYDTTILTSPTSVKTGTLSDGKTVSEGVPGDGIGDYSLGVFGGLGATSDGILIKIQFTVADSFVGSKTISFEQPGVKTTLFDSGFSTITTTYSNGDYFISGLPTGTITLTPAQASITADGTATTTVTSAAIKDAQGDNVPDGTKITVATDAGTITTADADNGTAGIQVETASGLISFTLQSATTAGTANVSAASVAGDATGSTTVDFVAGAVDAGQSTVAVDTATNKVQTDAGGITVTVTLKDANDNPVANTDVKLSVTGSGNYINGTTEGNGPTSIGTTNASGVASGFIRSTKAEAKTISAVGGSTSITATQAVTFTPDTADAGNSTVGSLTPATIASNAQATATITFMDQFGNATTALGGAALTADGSALNGAGWAVVDNGDGTGTATYTPAAAGSETALAVKLANTQIGSNLSITVQGGPATAAQSTITAWGVTKTDADTAVTATVQFKDQFGNATSDIGGAALTADGNTLDSATWAVTDNGDGTGTATYTPGLIGSETALKIKLGGVQIGTDLSIDVDPGVATASQSVLNDLASTSITAIQTTTATVQFKDQHGNATNDIGSAALAASGAVLNNATWVVVDGGSGTATATYTPSQAGSETALQITLGGTKIGPDLSELTVSPGPADATQSTLGSLDTPITADETATVTINWKDAKGNTVFNSTGTTITASGATLGGATWTIADDTLTKGKGTYTPSTIGTETALKLFIDGVQIGSDLSVVVTPGVAVAGTSTVSSLSPSPVTADNTATSTIQFKDQHGNDTNVLIGVTLAASGKTLGGATWAVVDNGDGTGTATYTPSLIGSENALQVTLNGTQIGSNLSVTVTPGVATAAQSTVAAVTPATITADATATATVTFKDQHGNDTTNIGGAALAASGAALTGATWAVVDNTTGTGTATYTPNASGTESTLQISLGGAQIGANLSVVVTPGAATQFELVVDKTTLASQGKGTTTVKAVVKDAKGNQLDATDDGRSFTFTVTTGTYLKVDAPATVTTTNGEASTTITTQGIAIPSPPETDTLTATADAGGIGGPHTATISIVNFSIQVDSPAGTFIDGTGLHLVTSGSTPSTAQFTGVGSTTTGNYRWALSSVGSIDSTTADTINYTAPATITGDSQKDTLTLTSAATGEETLTDTLDITIYNPLAITYPASAIGIALGDTTYGITASGGTGTFKFQSTDVSKATVDADGGGITPVLAGTCTIQVRDASYGDFATDNGFRAVSPTVEIVNAIVIGGTPTNDVMSSATSNTFTATGGKTDGEVDWKASAGSITAGGVFTAPTVTTGSQQVTITAFDKTYNEAHLSPVKTEYQLTVYSTLAIAPSYDMGLVVGDNTKVFTASGGNASGTGPNVWTTTADTPVDGSGNVGTVAANNPTTTATFTAVEPGTIKVQVTDDKGLIATSGTIQVVDPIVIGSKPANDALASAGTNDFSTTGGTGADLVDWETDAGSIDANGLFTAPTVPTGSVDVTITAYDKTYNKNHATPIMTTYTFKVFGALAVAPDGDIGLAIGDTYDFAVSGGNAAAGTNVWSTIEDTPTDGSGNVGTVAANNPTTTATFTAVEKGTIKVQAADDKGLTAVSGTIEVVDPIVIGGKPGSDTMSSQATNLFNATGGKTGDVDWEADAGTISTAGLFTAPTVTTGTQTVTITAYDKTYNKAHLTSVMATYTVTIYPETQIKETPATFVDGTPSTYTLLRLDGTATFNAADNTRTYDWTVTDWNGTQVGTTTTATSLTVTTNDLFTANGAGVYIITLQDKTNTGTQPAVLKVRVPMKLVATQFAAATIKDAGNYDDNQGTDTYTITGGPAGSVYGYTAQDLSGTEVTAANCGTFTDAAPTDADNVFNFTNGIPSAISFKVKVYLDKDQYDNDADVKRLVDAGLDVLYSGVFNVTPKLTLSGKIVDGDGNPVAGATVTATHDPLNIKITGAGVTAADGTFTLTSVDNIGVTYKFLISKPGTHIDRIITNTELKTAADAGTGIELKAIGAGGGTIAGTITLQDDAAPFANGTVTIQVKDKDDAYVKDPDGNTISVTANPADGTYTFPVPPDSAGDGPFTVEAKKSGYIFGTFNGVDEGILKNLGPGLPVAGADDTLKPITIITVSGIAQDVNSDGEFKQADDNVLVEITAKSGGAGAEKFDNTGVKEISVDSDAITVTYASNKYSFTHTGYESFTITVDADVVDKDTGTGYKATKSWTYTPFPAKAAPTVNENSINPLSGTPVTTGSLVLDLPKTGLNELLNEVTFMVKEETTQGDFNSTKVTASKVIEIELTNADGEDIGNTALKELWITMNFDPTVVKFDDLRTRKYVIFHASSIAQIDSGSPVPASDIDLDGIDYGAGKVKFRVFSLSAFGIGEPTAAAGGGGSSSSEAEEEEVVAVAPETETPSTPTTPTPTPSEPAASDSGSSDCFIATAAFGSPFEVHVKTLRKFRDAYLLPVKAGRAFVRTYYRYSPPVADFIAEHDSLRKIVQVGLMPFVGMSHIALNPSVAETPLVPLGIALYMVLGTMAFSWRKRRIVKE